MRRYCLWARLRARVAVQVVVSGAALNEVRRLSSGSANATSWCRGAESNCRHSGFQLQPYRPPSCADGHFKYGVVHRGPPPVAVSRPRCCQGRVSKTACFRIRKAGPPRAAAGWGKRLWHTPSSDSRGTVPQRFAPRRRPRLRPVHGVVASAVVQQLADAAHMRDEPSLPQPHDRKWPWPFPPRRDGPAQKGFARSPWRARYNGLEMNEDV